MSYEYDRTAQLASAHVLGRFGQKASLQAAGVPTRQHNVGVETEKPKVTSKKTAAKKVASKKTKSSKKKTR